MKELDFFDAMTEIDDAYVLEAHESAAHRSTAWFGGFRRAAVLAAAVMMVVVTVVATGGDLGILRPSGWVRGDVGMDFDMDYENRVMIIQDSGTYNVEGDQDIPAESITEASATQLRTETVCQGEQVQIIQEAMILMDDGHSEYKSQVTEGTDAVVAVMDNLVDGMPGMICNVRLTVAVLTEEADSIYGRQTIPGPDGKIWVLLQNWNMFLPTQLHFEYPVNVDFRFPDMQYNYDGRGSAAD